MNNKQNNTIDLNDTLRSLIKETPVNFENRDKLAELEKALTSNDYFKRSIIEKFNVNYTGNI